MSKIIVYISVFILSILPSHSSAQSQKNITNQRLVWYGYFNTAQLSSRYFLISEIQERHFISPFAQSQLVLRSHIHRNLTEGWDVALGTCLFLQGTNDPYSSSITVPELRPHLEFNYKQSLKRFKIEHRYKFETRFFHDVNDTRTDLEDGFDFGNFRFRYRLQFTIPLLKYAGGGSFKLKLSNETLINSGSSIVLNTFDQNRIYGGLQTDLKKGFSLEIGYLNWFQKRTSGADFYNRNILRITIAQRIDFSQKN